MEQLIFIILVWVAIFAASNAKSKKKKQSVQNSKVKAIRQKPIANDLKQSREATKTEQPLKQPPKPMEGETVLFNTHQGSIVYESMEGIDTCDESLAHGVTTTSRQELPDEQAVTNETPHLDIDAVRNGFIVGEILNRPAWKRVHH